MKVLHLISSSGMYGAESVVLNLTRELNNSGNAGILAAFSHAPAAPPQLYTLAKSLGIPSHLISCKGQVDPSVPPRIRDLISREKIDVLHTHGYKADVYARFAMRQTGIPLVSTCHTWHDVGLRDRIYGRIDRYALRDFDAVIAVSAEVEQRLLRSGVSREKIHRIRNGIDTNLFDAGARRSRKPGGILTVGLACRLAEEKGPDLFLQMAANILQQLPATRFLIAGDGDLRAALQQSIAARNIASQVSLLGRVDNMPEFYSSLDILISCSRSEGFPIGLLEAMAAGLPIVAAAVGDVPAIVSNGRTGLLVPPENVAALTDCTLSLLRDAHQREEFGRSASTLAAREFSAARMTLENIRVYSRILCERKKESLPR